MGKNLLVGIGGRARKVKALYVGVGGKARKVKKVYVGVGGKARLVYTSYVAVSSNKISLGTTSVSSRSGTIVVNINYSPVDATYPPFLEINALSYCNVTIKNVSKSSGTISYTIYVEITNIVQIPGYSMIPLATIYTRAITSNGTIVDKEYARITAQTRTSGSFNGYVEIEYI